MNDDHGFGQDEFEDELLVLLNTRDPELICAVIVALAGSGDRALAYICQKVVLEDC